MDECFFFFLLSSVWCDFPDTLRNMKYVFSQHLEQQHKLDLDIIFHHINTHVVNMFLIT